MSNKNILVFGFNCFIFGVLMTHLLPEQAGTIGELQKNGFSVTDLKLTLNWLIFGLYLFGIIAIGYQISKVYFKLKNI